MSRMCESARVVQRPPAYAGHSPLGRLAVLVLLLVLGVQGLAGLVLAGTDIYYPPFGLFYLLVALVAAHIAAVVVTEVKGGGTLVSA